MFFNRGQENVRRKCKSRLIQLKITLKEAYKGGKKEFEYSRRIICKPCTGTGAANPNSQTKCSGCNGKGVKMVVQKMGNMLLQSQQTCPDCKGEGEIIKEKCKTCKAEKVQFITKKMSVDIDLGIPDGHRYNFNSEGDEYPDVDAGDLVVEVYIEKDKSFIRKGADLVYKSQITLVQALTGVNFMITHLDGKKVLIKSKEGEVIKPGVFKTVEDLGMPFFGRQYKYGKLYIDFEIVFPTKLDDQEVKKITEVIKIDISYIIYNI